MRTNGKNHMPSHDATRHAFCAHFVVVWRPALPTRNIKHGMLTELRKHVANVSQFLDFVLAFNIELTQLGFQRDFPLVDASLTSSQIRMIV